MDAHEEKFIKVFALIFVMVSGFALMVYKSEISNRKERMKEIKESKSEYRKEIKSWGNVSLERYSDLEEVRDRCSFGHDIGEYKKISNNMTGGKTKEIKLAVDKICSDIDKILDSHKEKMEDFEDEIDRVDENIRDINSRMEYMDEKRIAITKRIDNSGVGETYIIAGTNDDTFGVINTSESDVGRITVGMVGDYLLDRAGEMEVLMRGGRTKDFNYYIIISERKARNYKIQVEKFKESLYRKKKSLKKVKSEIVSLARDKTEKQVEKLSDIIN